jgi:hypothetical protein
MVGVAGSRNVSKEEQLSGFSIPINVDGGSSFLSTLRANRADARLFDLRQLST